MRVSEFQIYAAFLNNLQRLRQENLETQNQVSTGKRVLQPSDDPISFGQIVSGKASLAVTEQRLRNIEFATSRIDTADNALSSVTNILFRLKELAVQLRSDTNGASERATAATEVKELFNELQQLANTRLNGQPVFTGTSTHGRATGAPVVTPVTLVDGVNDTLVVEVDGVASGTLDLTSGTETLTGTQLATRLQSRINTDATLSAAGKSVTIAFTGTRLDVISNSFGADSTVLVTSGSALADLGFDGGSRTTGSNPFSLIAEARAAFGNTGGAIIAQGTVRDPLAVTLDDYVIQFTSATSFSVHNISQQVGVSPDSNNAGGAVVGDHGVDDPSQVRLDAYEIRPERFYTVTAANNALRFDPGSGPPVTVTVTAGRYSGDQLAAAVQSAMNAASGGDTYTVTLDGATGEFSITNDAGNAGPLDLMFDDPATTIEDLLGFPPTLETVQVAATETGGDSTLTSGAVLKHHVLNTTVNSAMFTITSSNNTVFVNGSPVVLTAGSYTGAELATEIQTRLGTGYSAAYSTAAGPPARLFTITNSTGGAVTINHSNAGSTVSELLGFDAVDSVVPNLGTDVSDFDAGTVQYLSGDPIDFGGLRVVLADDSGPPRHGDVFAVSLASQVVLSNQTYASGGPIDFKGLRVAIRNGAGVPASGDLFRVLVQSQYQGDGGIQAIEVQDNQTTQTNLPGNEVFDGPTIDLLSAVKRLTTALRGDYGGGIGQAIDDVDQALEQVAGARGQVGAFANRLESTSGSLKLTQELLIDVISQREDADLVTLVSELVQQETAIQAASQAGSRILSTSLLNFLR